MFLDTVEVTRLKHLNDENVFLPDENSDKFQEMLKVPLEFLNINIVMCLNTLTVDSYNLIEMVSSLELLLSESVNPYRVTT